jgi:hypothetical protein
MLKWSLLAVSAGVASAVSSAAAGPLPPGFLEINVPGVPVPMYYNTATQQVQAERPQPAAPPPLPAGWTEINVAGKIMYMNMTSGTPQVQADRPGAAPAQAAPAQPQSPAGGGPPMAHGQNSFQPMAYGVMTPGAPPGAPVATCAVTGLPVAEATMISKLKEDPYNLGAEFNTMSLPMWSGYTPMIYSCYKGYLHVVKHLESVGVPLDRKDAMGNLPKSWAKAGGHSDIIIYIESKGF